MTRPSASRKALPAGVTEGLLASIAGRTGITRRRLKRALVIASLKGPEQDLLQRIAELAPQIRGEEERIAVLEGLVHSLRDLVAEGSSAQALDQVDDPMAPSERARVLLAATLEQHKRRASLLADCMGAAEIGELTGRSRQAVESQRRRGGILALPKGGRWWYPSWQLDPSGPAGLVAGLRETLERLDLSPYGAAHWLTTSKEGLGGDTPLECLRRGMKREVLELAEAQRHLP